MRHNELRSSPLYVLSSLVSFLVEPQRKVASVAFFRHYRDHLQPIWDALPDGVKGPITANSLLLLAGAIDSQSHPSHEYVYVEHGAGQSYSGDNPSYAGGEKHERCRLFIAPHERAAERWRSRYPTTAVAVVGCPKLDPWHRGERPQPDDRTVAITFHWDCHFYPETRSAFRHYSRGLPAVVASFREQGWHVLGHAHPRAHRRLSRFWATLGVEYVENGSTVLDRAAVLVADNTSLMAEMMSLDRPVLALNAPWYRRDVSHGERFWDWPLHYVDSPSELAKTALGSLESAHWHPYAYADGQAAQRASEAILAVLGDDSPDRTL